MTRYVTQSASSDNDTWRYARIACRLYWPVVACAPILGLVLVSTGCGFSLEALVEDYLSPYDEAIAATGDVAVHIINETEVPADVEIGAGVFVPPSGSVFDFMQMPTDWLVSVGSPVRITVSAGGTAIGTGKCGDAIGVSVRAPADVVTGEDDHQEDFGLRMMTGNIALTGAGVNTDSTFTGDVVFSDLVRYVRPEIDGLDCGTDLIIIRISTPAVAGEPDPETGEPVGGASGTGTVEIASEG